MLAAARRDEQGGDQTVLGGEYSGIIERPTWSGKPRTILTSPRQMG
jgi:hypothetical protein